MLLVPLQVIRLNFESFHSLSHKIFKVNAVSYKVLSLVFNNTGILNAIKFTFNGAPIESVRKYSYLGVTFAISENFTNAKTDLYKKGLKAYFKLRICFEGNKPKIKTWLHVFDHTVKPVLLYGS